MSKADWIVASAAVIAGIVTNLAFDTYIVGSGATFLLISAWRGWRR